MENGRVDYLHDELRDLRHYITERFDGLEQRLAAKADASDLDALAARLAAVERDHVRWSLPRLVGGAAVLSALSAGVGILVARMFGV